ncbi:metal-dependent hydrolase [Lachnospira pectinoschiza]|uniref:LexA-binding, inner membrane-associated putative hydrolase n=1 Tax=Lachnospira pectinoschiza TaxID=28052 RepID=A0A1G9UMB4_9FIRM|nr:metal-dependent hydrolase [Lachnospira pectinoschiza]SDM61038.1 LexA-binding, inner membrane-associated putative hydrolase [Lachnospira pectinoschiza]
MQTNTHLAVGACLGLTLTLAAPREITVLGLCATSIGAIIPDIDIDGTGKKETKYIIMGISAALALVPVLAGLVCMPGIFELLKRTSLMSLTTSAAAKGTISLDFIAFLIRTILGFTLFIGLCAFSNKTDHRTFSHSFMGTALFTFSIALINPLAAGFFLLGYLSHIGLDLLNYRPVMLMYPKKRGFSFRFCYSKSRFSLNLLIFSVIILIIESIMKACL